MKQKYSAKLIAGAVASAALIAGVAISGPAAAQTAQTSATANAVATIVQAMQLQWDRNLLFGEMDIPSILSTVSVTADAIAVRTILKGDISLFGDGQQSAQFTVTGAPDREYTVSVPPGIEVIRIDSGLQTLDTYDYTHNTVTVPFPDGNGKLDGTGSDTIYVGASLDVPPGAAPGTYRGVFFITVGYL